MCEPDHEHIAAKAEYAKAMGLATSASQRYVLSEAWDDAKEACNREDTNMLRGPSASYGRLFVQEQKFSPLLGRTIRAHVVVARYKDPKDPSRHTYCVDIFAADISASPWLLKSDPQDRAYQLLKAIP